MRIEATAEEVDSADEDIMSVVVDARVRTRKDLDRLLTANQRSDELDVFVRATWRYNLLNR